MKGLGAHTALAVNPTPSLLKYKQCAHEYQPGRMNVKAAGEDSKAAAEAAVGTVLRAKDCLLASQRSGMPTAGSLSLTKRAGACALPPLVLLSEVALPVQLSPIRKLPRQDRV